MMKHIPVLVENSWACFSRVTGMDSRRGSFIGSSPCLPTEDENLRA